jgi:hypothetical protein
MNFHRDGSAVELVGMCAGVVKWLSQVNKEGLYPYDGVECQIKGLLVYMFFLLLHLYFLTFNCTWFCILISTVFNFITHLF